LEASTSPRTRHVTHLVNCFGIGGTERQLVELLRHLDRGRVALDVCCLQKVGEHLASVRELGLEPKEFHLRGSLASPNTGLQVARLAWRLRKHRSSLLHCHDFYSNLVGSAAARLAGVPCIVSRRDQGAWTGPWRRQASRLVARNSRWVLCNSTTVRDQLVRDEGLPEQAVRHVPNGLDLARFDESAARPLASAVPAPLEGQPVFAVVGNMKHAVKGHALLLSAAARLAAIRPDALFLLAGDGELRPSLEARARALGLSNRVHFLGRRTDVPALLRRCHAAVCPSESEGLSNAVMEAMAARLPVVATAVGGNPELVRDGRTGFLVPAHDALALADRMAALAADRPLALRMGEAGRRHVEAEYSTKRMIDAVMDLYADAAPVARDLRRAA
jgi:glycosyltransferase involved in cell wall biosynthesis